MRLTKNEIKQIKKYTKQRGGNEPALNYKTLRMVYEDADIARRKLYLKEMQQYAEAIKDKRIEKGQSILHTLTN
jgi:hypothetical protein